MQEVEGGVVLWECQVYHAGRGILGEASQRLRQTPQLPTHIHRYPHQAVEELHGIGAAEQQDAAPYHVAAVVVPARGWVPYTFELVPPADLQLCLSDFELYE